VIGSYVTNRHETGRFRPDFLDRCKWDAATKRCTGSVSSSCLMISSDSHSCLQQTPPRLGRSSVVPQRTLLERIRRTWLHLASPTTQIQFPYCGLPWRSPSEQVWPSRTYPVTARRGSLDCGDPCRGLREFHLRVSFLTTMTDRSLICSITILQIS